MPLVIGGGGKGFLSLASFFCHSLNTKQLISCRFFFLFLFSTEFSPSFSPSSLERGLDFSVDRITVAELAEKSSGALA